MSPRIVLITASSQEEARRVADALVEPGLAACVNIVPGVESVYRWEGAVQRDAEWLLIVKTSAEKFDALRAVLQSVHSYDCPECVALLPKEVSPHYLAWWHDALGR